MKITGNFPDSNPHAKNAKDITQLKSGEVFKATILDIKPNEVTLKFLNDGALTAKTTVTPDAHIGEQAQFMVASNENGQILLKFVKGEISKNAFGIASNALSLVGLPVSQQNVQIVKALMDNNLPIDNETVKKSVYVIDNYKGLDIEKLLFLLKEDLPIDEKVITELNKVVLAKSGFESSIETLIKSVTNLSLTDENEKIALLSILSNNKDVKNITKKDITRLIDLNFRLKPDSVTKETISEYFSRIVTILNKAKEAVNSSESESLKRVAKNIEQIERSIDFMSNINKSKEFFQLPFILGDTKSQADLYIFKNKNNKIDNNRASALLSLDLANLGHIETFVEKNGNKVVCQFRLENEKKVEFAKKNTQKLFDYLKEKGYNLNGATFKILADEFTILNSKEDFDVSKNNNQSKKSYTFDMRV